MGHHVAKLEMDRGGNCGCFSHRRRDARPRVQAAGCRGASLSCDSVGRRRGYAERVVRATYPGLVGEDLVYTASLHGGWTTQLWDFDSVEIQVYRSGPVPRVRTADDLSRMPLNVRLDSDARGLRNLSASGAHASQSLRFELAHAFDSRGPWSVDRVRAQLQAVGAKYIDDAGAVASRLPVHEWTTIFGNIRIGRPRLNIRDSIHGRGAAEWEVTIEVSRPAELYFQVSLEPFEGRVVAMHRRD